MHTACLLVAFLAVALAAAAPSSAVRLNNGVLMPKLAFGANVWDAPTCLNATQSALKSGFRFVWSSQLIGDECQAAQHQAIVASKIPRAELFIAGTADTQSCADERSCYDQTSAAVTAQEGLLGGLDMIMLDYPSSAGCEGIQGQWRALEEWSRNASRVVSVAVSNFDKDQLLCLQKRASAIVPTVNQMPFSIGTGTDALVRTDASFGVVVQAYSPLGGGQVLSLPAVLDIAKAHQKSPAQVALRWILQHNVTVNTQSTNPAHLQEDVGVFGFELSESEMKVLDAIKL